MMDDACTLIDDDSLSLSLSARLLRRFYSISFHGHRWEWDDKTGLSFLYKARDASSSKMTPWTDIKQHVDYCLTTENFHYFDGVVYTDEGLTHRHQVRYRTIIKQNKQYPRILTACFGE
jgi:hypothetical protein